MSHGISGPDPEWGMAVAQFLAPITRSQVDELTYPTQVEHLFRHLGLVPKSVDRRNGLRLFWGTIDGTRLYTNMLSE